MEKLKMMSMDKTQMNIQKIKEQFPNAVTEVLRNGKPALAVDFDVLKQELSAALIDEREERYQFTWPDKRKSVLLANSPISATLRPCREESVNFDTTQNLYIEGDNLDVLKLLQETYLGKIKMIYIDPPYNTGNDFVYKDDFSQSAEEYAESSGQIDEQGNRLFQNTESNGRFHTDWLNMMYPRLKVAKDLLSDDGVIFISIDDNELSNIRKICDEIFNENNFVANIIWQSTAGSNTGENTITTTTENILVYSKSQNRIINRETFENNGKMTFKDEYFERRVFYALDKLDSVRQNLHYSEALNYAIECPDGTFQFPGGGTKPQSGWNYLWSKNKVKWGIDNGFIVFKKTNKGYTIYNKRYEKVDNQDRPFERGNIFRNFIPSSICTTATGSKNIAELFNGKPFDYPKPIILINKFVKLATKNDSIILDFFSGSATTAHAVMQLNAEDGGNRKFIMVQLPEKCDEKSEAYKAGYKNICEIGKERIRRAGKKIQENIKFYKPLEDYITEEERESGKATIAKTASNGISGLINEIESGTETFIDLVTKEKTAKEYSKNNPKDHYRFYPDDLDIGFRVLKLDSSNMKDVYYRPEQYRQSLLEDLGDNIKEDRTPLDLLFQVMLELGKPLSARIEEKDICGKHVFIVDENDLIACFDADVTAETVKAIALLKPLYAVFRDSSLADDAVGSNFDQIFATYSPNTTRRVL